MFMPIISRVQYRVRRYEAGQMNSSGNRAIFVCCWFTPINCSCEQLILKKEKGKEEKERKERGKEEREKNQ